MEKKRCTFFGHRDCGDSAFPVVMQAIEDLILQDGVTAFYVGDAGGFDRIVQRSLSILKRRYPQIDCTVILSSLSGNPCIVPGLSSLFPEGLENVPPRFAIDRCNRFMLRQADIVLTCIQRPWGGAAKYTAAAERLGKRVIRIQPF
ncbi:MAG: hypothetical protein E7330_02485 [Clostridiales bacterium]|nr:hypothetical protein [Clostridiales bacterium]